MTNTTATATAHPITEDPRFNESGTMAYRGLKDLCREHFGNETAAALGLRAIDLHNQGWRPSDAIRKAIGEHLAFTGWPT